MMNIQHILQVMWAKGATCKQLREVEPEMQRQLKATQQFGPMDVAGGWFWGHLTKHGVVFG